jgi:hypothetical protein
MPRYLIEDPPYTPPHPSMLKLIRTFPEDETRLIERYSPRLKRWVEDVEMLQIYFGGIEVRSITEEEANRLIREVYNID